LRVEYVHHWVLQGEFRVPHFSRGWRAVDTFGGSASCRLLVQILYAEFPSLAFVRITDEFAALSSRRSRSGSLSMLHIQMVGLQPTILQDLCVGSLRK